MTTEPPYGEEEGHDLGRIPKSEVPTDLAEPSGDENAVFFIPEGVDPSEFLNVRVVSVNSAQMQAIIARRC